MALKIKSIFTTRITSSSDSREMYRGLGEEVLRARGKVPPYWMK
jgi:hypothetical protein